MPIVVLFFKFIHCWFKTQRNLAIENMALKQQWLCFEDQSNASCLDGG